jgi:hypothetical protein
MYTAERFPARSPIMALRVAALVLVVSVGSVGYSKDETAVEKQKTKAAEVLKQGGVAKPGQFETGDLLVYSSLPDTKTKAVAEAAQKTFALAKKTLSIDDKDIFAAGKLTVYVVPDWKGYAELLRPLAQRKPDKGEVMVANLRVETPYVAVGSDLGEKPTDADVQQAAATWVAAVLLNKKAGMANTTERLPEWLQLGFGRAAYLRAENNAAKLTAYRTKAKALAVGSKTRLPSKLTDAWAAGKEKDYDTLVTSVADFLAFGPDGFKFPTVLTSLKPTETNMNPTIQTAFAAVEWKESDVETYWRAWVVKGSK